MNDLRLFNNPDFGAIRTILIDGEVWFVGKDVAERLGYTNPQKAIRDHVDEDDKGVNDLFTPGGNQPITIINTSGLYSLVLSSKLPNAKAFKRWITKEVIPQIRKTGSYSVINRESLSPTLQAIYAIADNNARLEMEQKRQAEAINRLETKVDDMSDIMTKELSDWFNDIHKMINAVAKYEGKTQKEVYTEVYKEVDITAKTSVSLLLSLKKKRMAQEGRTKTDIEKVSKLSAIYDNAKVKAVFEAIVKRRAMACCGEGLLSSNKKENE